jgi:hypothetical protein
MTERLAEAHLSQRELEGLLIQHETRANRAESMLLETRSRMRSLEQDLAELQARGADAVSDLVDWDEQAVQKTAQKAQRQRNRKPTLKQA